MDCSVALRRLGTRAALVTVVDPRRAPSSGWLAAVICTAAVLLLVACDSNGEGATGTAASSEGEIHRADFHQLVVEALERDGAVTHIEYTAQMSEGPVEEHEVWIDWSNERARREQRLPDGSVHVTRVLEAVIYEDGEEPHPMDEGFEVAALPRTHLFEMLPQFPDGDFLEMPHEVAGDDMGRRYRWSIDSSRPGHDFCAEVTMDVRPDDFVPVRAHAVGCPGRPLADARFEYEFVEFVPPESLPDGFFGPGETPDGTPAATFTPGAGVAGADGVPLTFEVCATADDWVRRDRVEMQPVFADNRWNFDGVRPLPSLYATYLSDFVYLGMPRWMASFSALSSYVGDPYAPTEGGATVAAHCDPARREEIRQDIRDERQFYVSFWVIDHHVRELTRDGDTVTAVVEPRAGGFEDILFPVPAPSEAPNRLRIVSTDGRLLSSWNLDGAGVATWQVEADGSLRFALIGAPGDTAADDLVLPAGSYRVFVLANVDGRVEVVDAEGTVAGSVQWSGSGGSSRGITAGFDLDAGAYQFRPELAADGEVAILITPPGNHLP